MDKNLRGTGTNAADQATINNTTATNTKTNAGNSGRAGSSSGNQDAASLGPQGQPGYQNDTTNQSDGR
jgi:hypothetical protein